MYVLGSAVFVRLLGASCCASLLSPCIVGACVSVCCLYEHVFAMPVCYLHDLINDVVSFHAPRFLNIYMHNPQVNWSFVMFMLLETSKKASSSSPQYPRPKTASETLYPPPSPSTSPASPPSRIPNCPP